ncbi:MAG: hypothetical protein A2W91_10650 [Bacteroidetes bacterium GWF2_38_335]|nr:MAG: hypothetical protein A2W91_10650 [Bacteroidetes bacterium GWF2_38_335]OFY81839.1 MAG: hypothetical protein A2281_06390 [Bacteroidetes bacterium RIFOXYA12_FULL_38_20]HBS87912.1 hypothetical protein [Bacteroidales bacterium]
MKRILILCLFAVFSLSVFSQPYKVTTANNYMKTSEWEKAKENIDPAILDSKTSLWARTWLFYGQIYKSISDSCMFNNSKQYCDLDSDALNKAYKGFTKAWVLNFKDPVNRTLNIEDSVDYFKFIAVLSNPKTAYSDFEDTQMKIFFGIAGLTNSFVNKGIQEFQKGDFKKSASTFETALMMSGFKSQIDLLTGEADSLIIDTEIIYYAALANEQAKNFKKTRELFKTLIDNKYGKNDEEKAKLYIYVANTYLAQKDTTKYVETLEKGIKKYPNEKVILVEMINYYIIADQMDKAKETIIKAINADPSNKLLHYNLGYIYDKEGAFDQAKAAYLKALEIDPNYFDAAYNLGALYFNKAVEVNDKCDEIPPTKTKEYEECKKQAENGFKEALPHLENAYKIDPKDKYTLSNLKTLYAWFKDTAKYERVKKELEELDKK